MKVKTVTWTRRIQLLGWLQLFIPLGIALCFGLAVTGRLRFAFFVVALCALSLCWAAVKAWQGSYRRQFIREARLPVLLVTKLRVHHPQLSPSDIDLVLRGLREFFVAYQRSGHKFVAMPSQVVDVAWHEFILHTRAYQSWCRVAFGGLLHHSPAEVLGHDTKRNDGLRRTWYWFCKEESIDPRKPTRLPILFALDKKLGIPGGFHYVPDCRNIDRQSQSDAYCGTDFGDGAVATGDAQGFGGEINDSRGSGGCGSSCGGDGGSGCGGGCGGGGD